MNKYADILLRSSLFSGIIAEDTDSVLDCLGAMTKNIKRMNAFSWLETLLNISACC